MIEDIDNDSKRIAIIGGGISGLSAAYYILRLSKELGKSYSVTIFESLEEIGGHAKTVKVVDDISMDIGFMVYNDESYPMLNSLFDDLGVESEGSDMSLCISLDNGNYEWNSNGNGNLKVVYEMLSSLPKFHKKALSWFEKVTRDPNDPRRFVTVKEWLIRHGFSNDFGAFYLLPMMSALWSASLTNVLDFPMEHLVGFLKNHCMLQIFNRPKWKTVKGRSNTYTTAIKQKLESLGASIQLCTPIESLKQFSKTEDKYEYQLFTNEEKQVEGFFDNVIFACHTNTIHNILKSSFEGDEIKDLLEPFGDISYADNKMYLHSDPKLMPHYKKNWSSWNVMGSFEKMKKWSVQENQSSMRIMEGSEVGFGGTLSSSPSLQENKECYISYYLNKLQNLQTSKDYFVTLNPPFEPCEIHGEYSMSHPQFTLKSSQACQTIRSNQGKQGLFYCGAWLGYGFHEDGCRSGVEVAKSFFDSKNEKQVSSISIPNKIPTGFFVKRVKQFVKTSLETICKKIVFVFLRRNIRHGILELHFTDGAIKRFGQVSSSQDYIVKVKVFDDWFFVKTCLEFDLGLARSYMLGYFNVLPPSALQDQQDLYKTAGCYNSILGDEVGLTRLLLLFIRNRDLLSHTTSSSKPWKNAFSTAVGLPSILTIWNIFYYRLFYKNTESGGSLQNIHAHYNLSNQLFQTFLDEKNMIYSSAIYDHCPVNTRLVNDTLEDAQLRKLDFLLQTANITTQNGSNIELLDIGFGWGGLAIRAASKYNCRVTGITLSKEQMAYAENKVAQLKLQHLITFKVIDYRTFASQKDNQKVSSYH